MIFTKDYFDLGGSVYYYNTIDRLPRDKDNAFLHGLSMFCRSWTFGRMTDDERERCINSFLFANDQGMIKGTFTDRVQIMNAIYHAFLQGIGYNNFNWREPGNE